MTDYAMTPDVAAWVVRILTPPAGNEWEVSPPALQVHVTLTDEQVQQVLQHLDGVKQGASAELADPDLPSWRVSDVAADYQGASELTDLLTAAP